MKMRLLGACLVLLCCRAVSAQSSSPVLKAMQDELSRSFEVLGHQETPPYFLSYEPPLKTPIFKKIGQLGEISINKNNNLQR